MALQIQELLALQAADTAIGALQKEKEGLDRGDRIERALNLRQSRLAQAQGRLTALETDQKSGELELKSLESKKHESSRKLYEGRITSPRELQALEQEVSMLERQRQRLDEQILRRMDELEGARKAVATAAVAVEEAEKALRIIRKKYDKDCKRIDEEMARLLPERDRLASIIDPEVLRRYDAIRRRQHNVGAVRVEFNACGGCRMKIGGALMRRVAAHEAYVYCESCSRYLFPPAEEAVAASR